ncbi:MULTISPECIES: hypothetical protein [Vibrio]|uniref:hypothetical protein n=1 Tax=Vibrio TaxID=662 RepID=UPI0015F54CD4|nr:MULTISPECIES: hypothetical protein [Vibrio]USD58452.1 hypothetical protein J4N44_27550 [Vibrio sp. SCSIO 43155]
MKGIHNNPDCKSDPRLTQFASKLSISYNDDVAKSDPKQAATCLLIEAVNIYLKEHSGLSFEKATTISALDINSYTSPDHVQQHGLDKKTFWELSKAFVDTLKVYGDQSESMIKSRSDFLQDVSRDLQNEGGKFYQYANLIFNYDENSPLSNSGKLMALSSGLLEAGRQSGLTDDELLFIILDVLSAHLSK